jgi:hypothetical protein
LAGGLSILIPATAEGHRSIRLRLRIHLCFVEVFDYIFPQRFDLCGAAFGFAVAVFGGKFPGALFDSLGDQDSSNLTIYFTRAGYGFLERYLSGFCHDRCDFGDFIWKRVIRMDCCVDPPISFVG